MEIKNSGGGENLPIVNYGVSMNTKKIYHSQKDFAEFYTKVELKAGGHVFHRYIDGLGGNIVYMAIDKSEYGTKFKILLKGDTQISALQFNIDSQALRAFVTMAYNIEFSEQIVIKFYKGENKQYPDNHYQNCWVTYPNIIVNEDGKEKAKSCVRIDTTECPKSRQLQTGKWNHDERDEWYYMKAQDMILRFNEFKTSNKKSNNAFIQQSTERIEKQYEANISLVEDELPF
jgi:hypothetical protein